MKETTATRRLVPSRSRRYSAATVIAAQRRVLKMVTDTIVHMSKREVMTLRACGAGGLVTLNEITEHIVAALHLEVSRDGQKTKSSNAVESRQRRSRR